MAARIFEDVQVGDELPQELYKITRGDLVNYAGVTGDANPIHFHEGIAKTAGFQDVLAHGMLTMGYAAGYLTKWIQDGAAMLDFDVRFVSPVFVPADKPGELEFAGRVKSLDQNTRTGVIALTASSSGKKIFGKALATLQFS